MKLDRMTLLGMVALSAISTDLYLSGIPQIIADFRASQADGQLTLGVFMLGICFGQLLYGPASDVYGRKPVLYVGLLVYIVATLACALAMSIEQLLVARLFQALAAASGPVLARAIVADLYSTREAAKIMALLTAAMSIIPALAPVVGSWMLYIFDWRSQFYALMVVGVAILLSSLSLPESFPRQAGKQFSFLRIWRQFVSSLRQPVFIGYAVIGGAQFGSMFCWISVASFVVIEQFSVRQEAFGYTFAFVVAGYILGAYVNSKMVVGFGLRIMIRAGLMVGTLSGLVILLAAIFQVDSLRWVLVSIFGIFFSGGLCLSNAQVAAMSVFPKSIGQASSVYGFFQYGLAAVAGTILGQFYNGTLWPLALAVCVLPLISWLCLLAILPSQQEA